MSALRTLIRGRHGRQRHREVLSIRRSLPYGHALAVLGAARRLGLERTLGRRKSRKRELALDAIIARILDSTSKLATDRALSQASATSSLGALFGLGEVSGNEMLSVLDWLLGRQRWIEKSLAAANSGAAPLSSTMLRPAA